MESDMKDRLERLVEWWKKNQKNDSIEGPELEKLRDIMARLCLTFVGRNRV